MVLFIFSWCKAMTFGEVFGKPPESIANSSYCEWTLNEYSEVNCFVINLDTIGTDVEALLNVICQIQVTIKEKLLYESLLSDVRIVKETDSC